MKKSPKKKHSLKINPVTGKIKAPKDARIDLRPSELEKAIIQAAALTIGQSVSDFLLKPAFIAAKAILQAKGYKISETTETLRGEDLILKADRIMWSTAKRHHGLIAELDLIEPPQSDLITNKKTTSRMGEMRKTGLGIDLFRTRDK